ncbi:acetoacetate decarboxylase [Aspergillus pseudoustus]|uniref:Acetoacetate decarboxylase n=1 Tax=Aspergillus pseudoustus TaxID=1810923 RepID=A0ABR4JB19_9EURO
MPLGTLSVSNTAIPQYAPLYPAGGSDYTCEAALTITYHTSLECVRRFVPDMLEVADEPEVTLMILQHTMTSFGPYTEYVHSVKVKYKGEEYDYFILLILDNDSPIACGREQFGFPKKYGTISLAFESGSSVVRACVERPAGQKIVEAGFQPEKRLDLKGETVQRTMNGLNLRVIPSVVVDQPPSVKELVPVDIGIQAGEVWQGSGSVCFPEPSAFDPMHEIKVLRYGTATLLRNASLAIRLATKVFSL